MKKFIVAVILITTFLLNSCEPSVTFDQPQPDNTRSLTSFPERMQGKYLSSDRAAVVTITDKLLTRYYEFEIEPDKDSTDESDKWVGVKQRVIRTDTLFNISADNILKKFKGYYFLNIHYGDNAWEVKKLSLKNGLLKIGSISEKGDIQKLKELTETAADTISTHFSLTRPQFKELVNDKGFADEETFTRMN